MKKEQKNTSGPVRSDKKKRTIKTAPGEQSAGKSDF